VPRQIRLNLNLQTAGRHDAARKRLGNTGELVTDVDNYVNIVKLAERGKLDAIFRLRADYLLGQLAERLGIAASELVLDAN
jgi:hypothetical protein